MRDLRQTTSGRQRRREITKEEEAESQFIKGVPDWRYIGLFIECFTQKAEEELDIDLRDYICKAKLKARKKKKYVIYNIGYGIKKDMVFRLYTLMRIYCKFITWGLFNVETEIPPWLESDDSFMEKLCGQIKCIDLTDVH
eukprot:UN10727